MPLANTLTALSLLLALMPLAVISEIDIWSPPQLRQLYKTHGSAYSIANFGVVPYGHTIIGTVKKAVPFDACQSVNAVKHTNEEGAVIMLVMRGKCHFAEKVINAQNAGAKLVIIVDNQAEDVHSVMPVERGKNTLEKVRWTCERRQQGKMLYPSRHLISVSYISFMFPLNISFSTCELLRLIN